jgi:DNA-binding NarL/FixJ family response regulator
MRRGEAFVAAAETIDTPGDPVRVSTGHAYHGLGAVYAALGRPVDARDAFGRARAAYEVLEHHAVIAFSLLTEMRDVVIPYLADRPAERRRLAAEAETAIAHARGAFVLGMMPSLGRLCCLAIDGDWDEALRIIAETPPPGNGLLRREITETRAAIAYGRGAVDVVRAEVVSVLPEGPDTLPGNRIHQEALFLQRLAADIALDGGDLDDAHAWIESHERWLSWSGGVLGRADGQLLRARWHRAAGEISIARSRAASARAQAAAPRQPLALLAAERLLGLLALDLGETTTAERHLAAAVALADACATPYERALSLLALAEVRLASSQLDDAARLLDDVRTICLPLGAVPTLARAESLAARLSASPTAFPAGLSAREVEVLRLVTEGLTDREVADRLSISRRTVSQHLRSVYGKLDVPSRAAATRFAVEHNLT